MVFAVPFYNGRRWAQIFLITLVVFFTIAAYPDPNLYIGWVSGSSYAIDPLN